MIFEIGGIAIGSAFIAGLLMFLAPCTLPLVPAYLGFISGVSAKDLADQEKAKSARRKIFVNGASFVIGFSAVFILLGLFAGYLGASLPGFQLWARQIGGVMLILFGFFMLGVFRIGFLSQEKRLKMPGFLTVGKPQSSLIIGAAFAVGWTPCVGPILAGILALATQSSTALSGAALLFIFSLGLAIPFLLIAAFFGKATQYIQKATRYLSYVEKVGGVFLIALGVLLLTDNFGLLIQYGFQFLDLLNYEETLYNYF